jgi:hypothetical protein
MKEKLAIGALALLIGVGLYYSHNSKNPVDDPAMSSSIAKVTASVKSICVTPMQNLTNKNVAMDGLDDEFVAQLNKVGFVSQKGGTGKCDATTHSEVVDITGRGRKTARVDFRLTLANEQIPRMSSSVEGKSRGKDGEKTVSEFKINPDSKESAGAEREAIVAALGKTAAQIDAANRKGLPPWSAKEQ